MTYTVAGRGSKNWLGGERKVPDSKAIQDLAPRE